VVPLRDRFDRRGGARQLGDLSVGQFRVEFKPTSKIDAGAVLVRFGSGV